MKKILSILVCGLVFMAINAKAQTPAKVMTVTSTSYSNTGADTATILSNIASDNVSIQPVVTKVSGTIAGKAFVWVSLDGVNYQKLTTDSMVLTNTTTNTKVFTIAPSKYLYYRVITTGTGTMAATFKSWFVAK